MYLQTTYPALQNIEAALIKAGLGRQVKVTVPLNADVYESSNSLPSSGDFRADIHSLMIQIVRFLQDNGGLLTINIYPFLSFNSDPHFPIDYAFFAGTPSPVVDGAIAYTNVFDANYDTLIAALERNGFPNMPVIVGEIGWPTDGDPKANIDYARKFNQGLLNRIIQGKGTPKRPQSPPDIYLFGLVDEDIKSIAPGNFERHWGIFYYDGTVKYPLVLADGQSLVPAKGVRYLDKQWCVLAPSASIADPNIGNSVNFACTYADCTSLGFGSSCNGLDVRSNISYALNQFYQTSDQRKGTCNFGGLGTVTRTDPSQGTCRFEIMIDVGTHEQAVNSSAVGSGLGLWRPVVVGLAMLLWNVGSL